MATLDSKINFDRTTLAGLGGPLAGVNPDAFLEDQTEVAKVGLATGTTRGRVTAFDLDVFQVGYGIGRLRFVSQVEIEGADVDPFSGPGDSGSLIVDAERRAVALLFCGTERGGLNGKGLTYANPIHTVLRELKVELLC